MQRAGRPIEISDDAKAWIINLALEERIYILPGTFGWDDLIVVDTDDATLICAKDSAGDINIENNR
ncbi:MAG: hypothetical protein RR768_10680 [Clostridium sp.]